MSSRSNSVVVSSRASSVLCRRPCLPGMNSRDNPNFCPHNLATAVQTISQMVNMLAHCYDPILKGRGQSLRAGAKADIKDRYWFVVQDNSCLPVMSFWAQNLTRCTVTSTRVEWEERNNMLILSQKAWVHLPPMHLKVKRVTLSESIECICVLTIMASHCRLECRCPIHTSSQPCWY